MWIPMRAGSLVQEVLLLFSLACETVLITPA
ncbi:hypothetical protein CIPAW_06G144500 [Carya illinoinensis]|uniref:Uncharacterized protein n=1 Tax=Carya illinoinensis TaxID=32201 RepID=A0A8T1QBW2_CARIL|nr:hypothetical protein CIPAW_06G144500 [Carya illinoinensis]